LRRQADALRVAALFRRLLGRLARERSLNAK
jgi:hypothetical protein